MPRFLSGTPRFRFLGLLIVGNAFSVCASDIHREITRLDMLSDIQELIDEQDAATRHPSSIQAHEFWTYAKAHLKNPGTFSIKTIRFLEQEGENVRLQFLEQEAENVRLQRTIQETRIIYQYSKNDWSKMQADVAYRRATFVIASTGNCLEGAMNHGGLKYGMQDLCSSHAVQGESAVMSTPWSGNQRLTDTYYNLLNHKTILFDGFFKTNNYKDLKVGIHFDVPVLGYLTQPLYHNPSFATVPLKLTNEPSAQLIHQIFVAAVNLNDTDMLDVMPDARADLSYMVRGAILALRYGKTLSLKAPPSSVIVIPFLGAGAFGNKWKWTIDAIADCIEWIKDLNLTVIINDFADTLDAEKYKYLKTRPEFDGITITSRGG
ncbi:MAG: hypothetical protein WCW33_05575 [Candidatus Babeliales bacterium]|jgi:hypothetical protein